MVYFDSNYLHVEYYAKTNVLISQWYGGCTSLQYRQALIKGIRLSKQLNIQYAVIDERLLPPLSEEDYDWMQSIYIHAFNKLPLKRLAVVNAFNSTTDQQLQEVYFPKVHSLSFETRSFEDLTSAYNWLVSETD